MTGFVNTGVVSVANTPTQIVPAAAGRQFLYVFQESNTVVRLGNSTVTTAKGVPLANTLYANIQFGQYASFALYGVVSGTGTANVSFIEVY